MSPSERFRITWPPPLRSQQQVTVLVRSPRSAFALIVMLSVFSVCVGLATFSYETGELLMVPQANGAMFVLAGLLAVSSAHAFWRSRWLAITAGTLLSTAALLRGVSIAWTLGWHDALGVLVGNPSSFEVARLIGAGQWMVYGVLLMIAWPGLVHDSSVPRSLGR